MYDAQAHITYTHMCQQQRWNILLVDRTLDPAV